MSDSPTDEIVYMDAERVPFTQVPDSILEDERTSQGERLVYWALWYHVNIKRGDRIVWPGQRRLATIAKMGRDTVATALKALVDHGYLAKVDAGGNRSSSRYLLTGGPKQGQPTISGPIQDRSGPAQDRVRSSTGPELEDERTIRSEGAVAPGSAAASPPGAGALSEDPEIRKRQLIFALPDDNRCAKCEAPLDIQIAGETAASDGEISEYCLKCGTIFYGERAGEIFAGTQLSLTDRVNEHVGHELVLGKPPEAAKGGTDGTA